MTSIQWKQAAPTATTERIDITSSAWKHDPFPTYARLRVEQPVCQVKTGQLNAWLVTRYDDAVAVLKDERFVKNRRQVQTAEQSAKRGWMPAFLRPLESNMLYVDGPDHARLRGLVHKAFTPQRIEEMQGRVHAVANQLIDEMQTKRKIDLLNDFALPLPLTVIADLLGIPTADRGRFSRWTKAIIKPPSTKTLFQMLPATWFFMRYLRQLFEARRTEPRDDLLTALLQAEESGERLSEDELLAMVFVLIVAGYETTMNLIASGMLALLEHPDQLERLRKEPELIRSTVEELLRFTNPVETTTERFAAEDITLAGVEIKRGELVLVALASANRDEQIFDNPDRLDITRPKNRHLAFGQGVHYCVGAPLARLEGAIAINLLVQRLPNLQLAVPADKLKWRATQIVRGLDSLPVTF